MNPLTSLARTLKGKPPGTPTAPDRASNLAATSAVVQSVNWSTGTAQILLNGATVPAVVLGSSASNPAVVAGATVEVLLRGSMVVVLGARATS